MPLPEACFVSLGAGYQGSQWPETLWGYVIGLELPLASYALGTHVAMYIDRYIVKDDVQLSERELEDRYMII